MSKIIILDEITKNQIAAGEVVERPVSVVKELVENSLDAGSKNITIDITGGGLEKITVTDDGCGIPGEEIHLAFQRHATSKINSTLDLNRVTTLGFRGEALPSIAAVSKVSVTTRTKDSLSGTAVELAGGTLISAVTAGCPTGTTVTVRELFYNTPVRRKTVKNPVSEGSLCTDLISKLSFSRPDVCFEMRLNGKRIFYSPGTNSLIDSAAAVYGQNQAREMIYFENREEEIAIKGLAGKPSISRSTRNHITIIINGRFVNCQPLTSAVEEAYRELLSSGRRPVAVISINVPPELTDINIHPAKLEIRLMDEEKLISLTTGVLRQALISKEIIPTKISAKPGKSKLTGQSLTTIEQVPLITGQNAGQPGKESVQDISAGRYLPDETREECPGYISGLNSFPALNALAALPPVYILAAGEDGLYIVDQHAAHERILYEEFFFGKEQGDCQYLLVPVTLELNYREAEILLERVIWFTDSGFVIEHFGGNTFLLRGVPLKLPSGQEKEVFLDLLDYLKEKGSILNLADFSKKLASTLACRRAVKAGEKLAHFSMNALLQELAKTKNPFTCPHGRPTTVFLSNSELKNRFKR